MLLLLFSVFVLHSDDSVDQISTIDRLVNKTTGELKIDRKMEIIFFFVAISIGLKLLSSHLVHVGIFCTVEFPCEEANHQID